MCVSYQNEGNLIFYGDAINILANHLASESVDLIFHGDRKLQAIF
jgi:hypothetical protein